MKSRYIVLLGLALSWTLAACVSKDKQVVQDEPAGSEQAAASAAEPVVKDEEAAPAEKASSAPVGETASSAPDKAASSTAGGQGAPASAGGNRVTLPGQYVIQRGDTFRAIAARPGIYWNESLWSNIYNANRDKIKNPDLILSGTVLSIPPLRDEIREGMWEANRSYENPFGTGVSGANRASSTTPAASAAPKPAPAAAQTQTRTPTNSGLVRRNVVSCKIAGVERADQISYVTLEWTGLGNANGVGTNVRIEAYMANDTLFGALVLENSHGYGLWNRYFSVSGEFLNAYNAWNDRIDFATIKESSIQVEHQEIGNVFIHVELDGSPFRN